MYIHNIYGMSRKLLKVLYLGRELDKLGSKLGNT